MERLTKAGAMTPAGQEAVHAAKTDGRWEAAYASPRNASPPEDFLKELPIGFASSTYFPLPDVPWLTAAAQLNPLHHLAEGLRGLLLHGTVTWHLAAASGLCLLLLAVLIPLDMRLLRKRVFGDA